MIRFQFQERGMSQRLAFWLPLHKITRRGKAQESACPCKPLLHWRSIARSPRSSRNEGAQVKRAPRCNVSGSAIGWRLVVRESAHVAPSLSMRCHESVANGISAIDADASGADACLHLAHPLWPQHHGPTAVVTTPTCKNKCHELLLLLLLPPPPPLTATHPHAHTISRSAGCS